MLYITRHRRLMGTQLRNTISNVIQFDLKIKLIKGPTKGVPALLTKYIFTPFSSLITGTPQLWPAHPYLPYLTEGILYTMAWDTTRAGVPNELTDPPLSPWPKIRNPRYNDAIDDQGGLPQTTLISLGKGRGMCYLNERLRALICDVWNKASCD